MTTAVALDSTTSESINLTDAMASIAPTKAALELEQQVEDISPHKLINLMLEGAIERIDQAQQTLVAGQDEETGKLIGKAVGIIQGLQSSLDHEAGGEIASRLDTLYRYINTRLCEAEVETGDEILTEAGQLLQEVKSGWQGISPIS